MTDMDSSALRPCLLLLIVPRKAEKTATSLIRACHIPVHFTSRAEGTASSDMLDMLGLESADKTLLLTFTSQPTGAKALGRVDRHPELSAAGGGVALTVPLTRVGISALGLLGGETIERIGNQMEHAFENLSTDEAYSLVLAIANQGHSDEIVASAKKAGAGGGTVVHARRAGLEDAMSVWGIRLQEEKELILIAIRRERRDAVMDAIAANHGPTTPAQAIAVSLPVDAAAGLDKDMDPPA